jgi:hypothetical protein
MVILTEYAAWLRGEAMGERGNHSVPNLWPTMGGEITTALNAAFQCLLLIR